MNATQKRVLAADDHVATLAQTARLIGEHHQVIGTVAKGWDLLEAARRLKQAGCRSRMVFLTVHEDADYAEEALALAADAYGVKSRVASDLMLAIAHALAGSKFVSETVKLAIQQTNQ